MEKLLIQDIIQFGALGVLLAWVVMFFRFLREQQKYKRDDIRSRETLAAAIACMAKGNEDLVTALKDIQLQSTLNLERCQAAVKYFTAFVNDLRHGVELPPDS